MNHSKSLFITVFGVGKIPGAPGTYGSFVALALFFIFPWKSVPVLAGIALFFFISGSISAGAHEKETGKKDDPSIVIDEVVGMWVALAFVTDANFVWALAAFVAFRFFDILKPYPVRKLETVPAGWGVMLDDLAAGLYAGVIIYIMRAFLQ